MGRSRDRSHPGAAALRPSLAPERYAGTYADSAFGTVEVTLAGAALRARFEKADLGELDHAQHDVLRSRPVAGVGAVTLTFVPDGMGGISPVRMRGVSFARARR